MNSLRLRVVAVASLVLAAFLGVTAVALERSFRDTGLELVREHLQAQVYALLAAAEPADDGRLDLGGLPEPRFSLPDSGLYALVRDETGRVLWSSRSLLDREIAFPAPQAPGVPTFGETRAAWGERLFALGYRVRWEVSAGAERTYDVQVAESRSAFDARVARFRRNLWSWLGAAGLVLLVAQAAVLTLGLAPLRRLALELRAIESGDAESLSEDQPAELRALASNMNQLIRFGRRMLERHRNALADLAHGLKTPLAVLRAAAEETSERTPLRAAVLDAVERMDETVSYRLRRASAAGDATLAAPVAIAPLVERVCSGLRKVYAGRGLRIETRVPAGLGARADSGDLLEILGNLLDNACKWARTAVRVEATTADGGGLRIVVDDDGPGVPAGERARVLERGARTDERKPGQGLGLSLVREIAVEHYGGRVQVGDGPLGGARVEVRLDVRTR